MFDVEERDEIALVRMRHRKANAMDFEFCSGLSDTLTQLERSPARAVVVTGDAAIFSAGVDLLQVTDGGSCYVQRFVPAMTRAFETLFMFPKPLVAAVNGHAIAGGCVLACAADARVMAIGEARIGIPELLVGVPFPAIALETMRRVCASHRFEELVYSGVTLDAQSACDWGLIDEAVSPDAVLTRAWERAKTLAKVRPAVFALSKQQLRQPTLERCRSQAAVHEESVVALWNQPETLDAIRDYVSRTFKRDSS